MRKILFFLLLLPALASLGYDAYTYYEKPDKGFGLSDLGAIWDKNHKESHDQWKTKVQELGQSVNDIVPENIDLENVIPENIGSMLPEGFGQEKKQTPPEQPIEEESTIVVKEVVDEYAKRATNDFSEGFTQSIDREGNTQVTPLEPEKPNTIGDNTRTLISVIGFLLEQKAVLVLGAIPLFFFLLNFILSSLFKPKEDKDQIKGIKKTKRKGGGYQYSRK